MPSAVNMVLIYPNTGSLSAQAGLMRTPRP